jgi:hypothetical protein
MRCAAIVLMLSLLGVLAAQEPIQPKYVSHSAKCDGTKALVIFVGCKAIDTGPDTLCVEIDGLPSVILCKPLDGKWQWIRTFPVQTGRSKIVMRQFIENPTTASNVQGGSTWTSKEK